MGSIGDRRTTPSLDPSPQGEGGAHSVSFPRKREPPFADGAQLPSPLRGGAGGWGSIGDRRTTPSLDPSPQGGGRRAPHSFPRKRVRQTEIPAFGGDDPVILASKGPRALVHRRFEQRAIVGGAGGAGVGGVAVVGERPLDHPVEVSLTHAEDAQPLREAEAAVERVELER